MLWLKSENRPYSVTHSREKSEKHQEAQLRLKEILQDL